MAGYDVTLDTANSLVTLNEAKDFIGDDLGTSVNDARVKRYINAASWLCNKYTKRLLKSREHTEYHSGDGTNTVFVRNYPVTTLTSVYDDPDRTYGSDYLIDSDDLAIMPDELAYKIVYDGGYFQVGIRNVKITYTGGYETIPYDLAQACLEIVAMMWVNSEERRFGIRSMTLGGGSITTEITKLPLTAELILENYRRKW